MKLSGRIDIGTPIDFAFGVLSDFDAWERAAMRRGADVTRTDKLRVPAPGMTWVIKFAWRGRERELQVRLAEIESPQQLVFVFDGPSVEGSLNAELVQLATKRTRMLLQVEIKPRSLAARLFIQSLKLAKTRVQKKFDKRLAQIAQDIETRFAELPQS